MKSVSLFLDRNFPVLLHWSRLPGLISWIAVSFGTAAAFSLPFSLFSAYVAYGSLLHAILTGCAVLLLIVGVLIKFRIVRFFAFFCSSLLLCLLHRSHQIEVYDSLREVANSGTSTTLTGRVTSPPLPYYENFHFLLKIDSVADVPSGLLRGITINCITPFEPPQYGRLLIGGTFLPPNIRRNPYEYDGYSSLMAAGVWGSFIANRCAVKASYRSFLEKTSIAFRRVALDALQKIKDYDNRSLLQASFLGDTEFLSPFIKKIFRMSGTYHLIAISGLNTAMLTSALYFLLRLLPLGKIPIHLICIATLWAYFLFVGPIPSLFRATIMATCIIAALLFEKKSYALQTLGLAGTIWLILSPESLYGAGYQLTFAATAGLLALVPPFSKYIPAPGNKIVKKSSQFLFSTLLITIACFLATTPVLLYHFGTISYFGLVANLVAVAAMTVSMWAFFAGLLLQMAVPLLAGIPLWFSERFLDLVVGTGKLATHFPWSQVAYPAPNFEIIILFSLFLIGLATVNKKKAWPDICFSAWWGCFFFFLWTCSFTEVHEGLRSYSSPFPRPA